MVIMNHKQELLDTNIKDNWFAKVGVQKPYTVFVCIMAIIMLGVFAFSRMSMDLFPAMNIPYAVVVLQPNTSYVMNEMATIAGEFTADAIKQAEADCRTAGKYSTEDALLADEAALLQIIQANTDATALAKALMAAAMPQTDTNGNIVAPGNAMAAAYLKIYTDPENGYAAQVLGKVMPNAAQMEKLTDDVLAAVSAVNGIKNTNSTTMLTMGVVMVTLEYNGNAEVDMAELALKFENLALDNTTDYGTKFQKTILKIDPSLLPVMYVTVGYTGDEDADTWLENHVLDKINTTVGVGSVSTNIGEETISTNDQDENQAWEGMDGKLTETFSIAIQKSSNAVTTDVCANVLVTLEKIKAENPNFVYSVTSSQGEYINQTIGSVGENLVVGGLLALVILFLFLR